MLFREYLKILEALTIIKKASASNPETIEARVIGKFNNQEVIKTKHLNDLRGSESRIADLTNEQIIDIIRRANNTGLFKRNHEHVIIYKTKEAKFNAMIVSYNEKFHIKTIIQQFRNSPNYKTKNNDIKILLESLNLVIINID